MFNVAILGYGVVGSGVATILTDNRERIQKKTGAPVNLKKIVDIRDFPNDRFESIITKDFNEVLSDPEINVIAETIGGVGVAYNFTKALLEAGKSVVSSNKELVATKGEELLAIAAKTGANYFFEAAVGGGIPVIKAMTSSLEANNYKKIVGILNGTTNYILTMMKKEGLTFDIALAQAQKLGYAEQDPTADIEGLDAQRKIAILADIAYGETISPEKVYTEGITKITPEIMTYAASKGYQVKLICYAEKKDGDIYTFVSPCAVSATSPLAGIEGVFNGVTVSCDCADDMTFIGRGAGSLPTASAVVADIIDGCMLAPAKAPLWKEGETKVFGLKEMNLSYLENTNLPIID